LKRAGILKIILSVFLCSLAFFVVPASPQSIPYPHDILSESSLYIYTLNLGNYLEMANTNYGTSIVNSFNDNFGIFNLNQSSGSLNNQANVSTITVTPGSAGRTLFDIDLDQLDGSFGNTISYFGTIHRESIIENSFERSKGLFMVNQSPGNLNQQSNIFALSLGLGSALMLSDFELATKSGENIIQYGPDTVLENKDIINNSFSGVTGVVLINQTSGDLNIIRNNVGISFSKETIR
jgi:hypothetical protein